MKLPVIIALLALAQPALAKDIQSWGATSLEASSAVQLLPGSGEAFVDLLCINNVTGGHPNNQQFDLSFNGVDITVFVYSPYDGPDIYTVAVPEGYRAEPPEIVVEEGSRGIIHIYLEWGV